MYITKEIQEELFRKYDTPAHVQRHCNAVAENAKKLAMAINATGYDMDVDLIYGAGLVHDVVRLMDHHAEAGAEILDELGYPREAELVRYHMTYPMPNDADHLEEIDMLCLSDRVVKEDEYVGIDERMEYLINKPGGSPERTIRILLAKEHTKDIIRGIEARLGMTLDELLG